MLIDLLFLFGLFQTKPAPPPPFFTSPYTVDEMRGKQAVMDTTLGTVVLQLLPESAPNHVAHFMVLAREGAYDGTIFHRVQRDAIVQGGDPLSRDPMRAAEYGSGGMRRLRAESRDERLTAGAVVATLFPNDADSAGSQFFICVGEQPGLDGQYTVFARVVEGLEVVQAISAVDAGTDGSPRERIAIRNITIRDTPPEPFANESAADLAGFKAVIETTMGNVELELLPEKAPETVRTFLRMAQAGIYDGIGVHRVASNFVIQTGALLYRSQPLLASQQRLVGNLPAEFTDTPNEPGIVSMARGEDPNSGMTSFFICIGACRALDGKYTVFARVMSGMEVVDRIAAVPVTGEAPVTPIVMTRVRVEKR
jgi:peptidyl-prolyl cis-trans isomerase B (cyclophilin B)